MTERKRKSSNQLFQVFVEFSFELRYLGGDHGAAVGLVPVVSKVFLMVVFSDIELIELGNCGDDWFVPYSGFGDLLDGFFYNPLLFFGVVVNSGAVLGADIPALTVEGGGVVDGEEDVEDVFGWDNLRIECDLNDLGVAGSPIADGLVAWIFDVAAGVP